jgi:hypothetical protein
MRRMRRAKPPERPAPPVDLLRAVRTLARVHGVRALVDAVTLVVDERERWRS